MKFLRFLFLLKILFWFVSVGLYSQEVPKNWFLLDLEQDGFPGVSAEKAYKEHIKGKRGQKIIVAILDSGVDFNHEDLKGVMWSNPSEIPGNNKDDDSNGYVDDIHGWNFIGGKDGRNVHEDTYEITRLYAAGRKKFENADPAKLRGREKREYELWLTYKEEVEKNQREARQSHQQYMDYLGAFTSATIQLEMKLGEGPFSLEELKNLDLDNEPELQNTRNLAYQFMLMDPEIKNIQELRDKLVKQIVDVMKYHRNKGEFGYNPDFDPRYIVGDNYADSRERFYGNNDVKGPDSSHGTHVAGIVAANRTNAIGIKGIARDVQIMSIRCVPDGDERDKDVANAIRYAVDNGASIINMSFGKGHSWDKQVVDEAVQYAAAHDVLLVHAAGNSSQNNDVSDNFPNPIFEKRGLFRPKRARNWIEVGALSPNDNENAPARFSNYGKRSVDIFAPGVQIYSTTPENNYEFFNGTSMAAPAVAGVAAMIRTQYPDLTAVQVREAILKSAVPITYKVKKPGTEELVPFSDLCVTGGRVDAFRALEYASKMKGKRKSRRK